jgi:predicted secreted protein
VRGWEVWVGSFWRRGGCGGEGKKDRADIRLESSLVDIFDRLIGEWMRVNKEQNMEGVMDAELT